MPVFTIETPTGQKLDIEADNEQTAISGAQQWHAKNVSGADTARDIAKSAAIAPANVAVGIGGLPGTIRNAASAVTDFAGEFAGIPKESTQQFKSAISSAGDYLPGIRFMRDMPDPEALQKKVESVTGDFYKPQTLAGERTNTIGQAVTGAVAAPYKTGVAALGQLAGRIGLGTAIGTGQRTAEEMAPEGLKPYAGFAGGVAGGIAGGGASKAFEALRNYLSGARTGAGIGDLMGGGSLKPGAVKRVGQNIADEELTSPQVQQKMKELGPEGMLVDMGYQLEKRGDFMAQHTGKAQNTIYKPIEARAAGAADRLNTVLDKHLGPPRDIVEMQNAIEAFSKKHVSPLYKDLETKYPVLNDTRLKDLAERPAIAHAMDQAKGVAANYGEKISGAEPSIRYWDYVKKSLDTRINGMMRSGVDDLSSSQKADLGGLIRAKSDLVEHLDTLTGGEYAQARKLAATKPAMQEGVDFGRSMFSEKLLPEEVRAHFRDLSIPEQEMVRVGVRREIERRVNTPGDEGRKLRSILGGGNNQEKLQGILGKTAANEISSEVAAADQFQRLKNDIGNTRTAARLEGMKDTTAPQFNQNPTVLGVASALPRTGINYALEHGMANTRQDISRILTAKGGQVDPVVKMLLKYNEQRAANAATPLNEQAKTLIRALISGAVAR